MIVVVGVAALVAGGVGALARAWTVAVVSARWGPDAGTATVNLSGSFALGLLVGAAPDSTSVVVLGTGLLGGYTTYSTWVVELLGLRRVDTRRARHTLALTTVGGLGLAAVGLLAGRALGGG